MLHLPILRAGDPYRSLAVTELPHVKTGQTVARVSQANPGLIARDLARAGERRRGLQKLTVKELLEICRRAARLFKESDLVVDFRRIVDRSGDLHPQQLPEPFSRPVDRHLERGLGRAEFLRDPAVGTPVALTGQEALDVGETLALLRRSLGAKLLEDVFQQ